MALSDLTFKLYTDSGLTTPFSGLYQLVHHTDLSDNPQDFVLYFGSTVTADSLKATSSPGVDQVTLTPTDIIPAWHVARAYIVGDVVEPTTPNTYKYRCTIAGTSHASTEPTWPTSGIGTTVTDGTVTWALVGKKHPTTEIKLASTSGGLAGATAGAAMNLGTTIAGGVAGAVQINIRVTNTVATVNNNTSHAELALNINGVTETSP